MSKEMVEKKKLEEEKRTAEEAEMEKEMENDKCPLCGTYTKNFGYVVMLPPPLGWLECPTCGNIFCPDSIRKRKISTKPENKVIVS